MNQRIAMMSLLWVGWVGAAGVARGQELVTNGGFETGNFSGWTQFGQTGYIGVNNHWPHSGQYYGFFGPFETAGIQQTLAVQAGTQVQVRFWYKAEFGDTPNYIVASLGSLTLADITNITSTTYAEFTAIVTVPESNPVLSFTFHDPPDYLDLDDVSVGVLGGCYANCDGSTALPILNVNDFVCFQSRFASSDPYADCDHSSTLNVNDFVCFQQQFAAGCP